MPQTKRKVMCVKNEGYPASLIVGKFYCVHEPDEHRRVDHHLRLGYIRVIDESGEDYLYPTEYFTEH